MSIDPSIMRAALDHLISALTVLRDHFADAQEDAAVERRLLQRVEAAALRDLAASDAEPK